ncbi:Metallo-hydrolase/oxidoreductase [Mycena crocata]|nr:Metallo-hydrolase/oxidoreductase [Mycena crocata]
MASLLKTSEANPSLPEPTSNQPYMHISAMQAGIIQLPADLIMEGEPRTYRAGPSLSFYLKHSASDRHFIFDLGLRRDSGSYPPEVQANYLQLMPYEVPQSVEESCKKGGLNPAEIEAVVISHLHFDHIGDCTPFSKAKFILGVEGKAALDDGYPGNPKSHYLTASTPADRTTFLNKEDFNTSIGPFPHAVNYFGDGSAYIIDTPGHCAGHITVLARTSRDGSWMYIGGDVAHDRRLITEDRKIAMQSASGKPICLHADPIQAALDLGRVRALVKLPQVEFVIAHDWKWYEDNLGHAFLPGKIVPKV